MKLIRQPLPLESLAVACCLMLLVAPAGVTPQLGTIPVLAAAAPAEGQERDPLEEDDVKEVAEAAAVAPRRAGLPRHAASTPVPIAHRSSRHAPAALLGSCPFTSGTYFPLRC